MLGCCFAAAVDYGWCVHATALSDSGVDVVNWGCRRSTHTFSRSAEIKSQDLWQRSLSCRMTSASCIPTMLSGRLGQPSVPLRMIVSFCGIVADPPVPGFDLSVIQRISNENGFRGVAVQLFKLLGMAAGQEEGLKRGAIKAAGQLCDFASPRRAECLEGMSAIAAGESFAKAVAAGACAAAARLQGAVVGPVEGALDLVLTLVEAAAQQGRRPAPKDEDSVVYVAGHNSWLPCSSWVLGAARDIVLESHVWIIIMVRSTMPTSIASLWRPLCPGAPAWIICSRA